MDIPSGKQPNITMENHNFQSVNPLFLWPSSIAMLVITRGYIYIDPIINHYSPTIIH
jgi:hypothetical protein